MEAEIILAANLPASGPILRLDEPLSIWGGVDPATGCLSDPRSLFYGRPIRGTILMIAEPRGSSSSSAVMLELFHRGIAPAAVILGTVDAIIGLGILVAAEMGFEVCPLLCLPAAAQRTLPQGCVVTIEPDGRLDLAGGSDGAQA